MTNAMSSSISPLAPQSVDLPQIAGVRSATAAAGIRYAGRTEVFLASTGVIGEPLDARKFANVMDGLVAGAAAGGFHDAAKAIMTTDTFAKISTAKTNIGKAVVTINGIAKGSGMIAPDMATM